MKTKAILLAAMLSAGTCFAQNQKDQNAPRYNGKLPDVSQNREVRPAQSQNNSGQFKSSAATLWSEDFGNGLMSTNGTWTITGANANLVGIDLDGPDNLIAQGFGPIASPTASNGFVNFDWYDKRNEPGGFSTTPTEGVLTSPVINLGANDTLVELAFHQELFWCCNFEWSATVDISTDGGSTFPNSVDVTWVDRNEEQSDLDLGTEFRVDISEYVKADPTNVVLRFNWTSLVADANGQFSTNYFWMIDDIAINELPENELRFTGIPFINGANQEDEIPKQDVIFDPSNPGHARYGVLHEDQIVPMEFDCNIYNYGSGTQNNVRLEVEILDDMGTSLQTLSSPSTSMAYGDTLDFNQFTTTSQWTPPSSGEYTLVYKALSDSIGVGGNTPGIAQTDTFTLFVSETRYSLDWGTADNFSGTDEADPDMTAITMQFSLENEDPDSSGSGLVFLEGAQMYLSLLCDTTADLEFAIHDTADFSAANGFTGNPIWSQVENMPNSGLGQLVDFDFRKPAQQWNNTTGQFETIMIPQELQTGTYYFTVTFFPNATDGVVRFANSQAFAQPGGASLFQNANGSWFGGFVNSRDFESPIVRLMIASPPPFDVSLGEDDQNTFSVYPNPTNGEGLIQFDRGGTYQVRVYDMIGQEVEAMNSTVNAQETLNFNLSDLPAGVYLVNIKGEGLQKTVKLTLQ